MEIKTAVIPVAGKGTRFLPVTRAVAKELLPLVDTPIIHHIVLEAARAGVERIVLITSKGKTALVDYFDSDQVGDEILKKIDIISVRQTVPRGLGHAVLCARPVVGKEPFALLLGDDVIDHSGDLPEHVADIRPGTEIKLKVIRKGAPMTLAISGLWLTHHAADFAWLQEKIRGGAVAVRYLSRRLVLLWPLALLLHVPGSLPLWKSLYETSGDLVVWADTDGRSWNPRLVYGTLGPLLVEPRIQYVKGYYQRPIVEGGVLKEGGGGRVTELVARPLINLFFPELSGLIQPLAGEYAGRRSLLESIPFFTGSGA